MSLATKHFMIILLLSPLARVAAAEGEEPEAHSPYANATTVNDGIVTDPPLHKPAPKPVKLREPPLPPAPVTPRVSPTQLANCQGIVQRFSPAYQALFNLLPQNTYVRSNTPLEQLAFAQMSSCGDNASRRDLIQAAITAVNTHSGRVGVILPLTGAFAKDSTYLVNGMRAAFTDLGLNFDDAVVLKDSAGSPNVAEARLAELIYKDRVAMIVGGFAHAEALSLAQWADKLLVPVIILNRDRDLTAASKYAFMIYPDEQRLAATLVQAAKERHLKRIALLRPNTGKADNVATYFKAALAQAGGTLTMDLNYVPGNFDSMREAARKLFHSDMGGREEEFKAVYKKAQEEAQDAGEAFNPRMVLLKPVVEVDAVFIPDDFRTVRYFAKIFRYQMVDHLTLLGNHEWRSPALIDPYDDFLNGSIFADFIGNYTKLPPRITAATGSSPFFIEPQNVEVVDFQLVGYRAASVVKAVMARPNLTRRQLPAALAALSNEQVGFPGTGRLFDISRHAAWPTYLFSVKRKDLQLERGAQSDFSQALPPQAQPRTL